MTVNYEPKGRPSIEFSSLLPSLSQPERIDYITHLLNSRSDGSQNGLWTDKFVRELQALPPQVSQDVALTIRARGVSSEQPLLDEWDGDRDFFLYDSYGVYITPGSSSASQDFHGSVTQSPDSRIILSAPTWKQARESLMGFDFGSSVVVLPETITLSGELEREDIVDREKVIAISEHNIRQMCNLSTLSPQASFIVGSPHFVEGLDLPYNAAFYIKNGNVVDVVHKFRATSGERGFFSSDKNRYPLVLQNASVLICRDISKYAMLGRNTTSRLIPSPAQFVADDTEELLIASCWSIGTFFSKPDPEGIDEHFVESMENAARMIFRKNARINKIILADRSASLTRNSHSSPIGTKPLSMVAFRSHDQLVDPVF